jgi:hypothetical protein
MSLGSFRLNTFGKPGSESGWLMYNTGARASNITPGGFDVDSSGNIYILDMYSSKLAKLDSAGVIQWQKYVSAPAAANSKGDGGLLALSPNGTYLYCMLSESATSMSLCQFLTSTGAINVKSQPISGTNIYIGNIESGSGSTYVCFGITVSGTSRIVYRRYNGGNNALTTTAGGTYYQLVAGATAIYDSRMSTDAAGATASNIIIAYQNYISNNGPTGTIQGAKIFTGGFDSIASLKATTGALISKDNIIAKFTGSAITTKAWEKTHTVDGVGGAHYYNQGMIVDSVDNIYACYWNSTAGKIIIYKLNTSGVLLWTKSISLNGATSVDAMMLKLSGTQLYLAFKYGAIDAGGMAILNIPMDGVGTQTFSNGFILANETGSLADTTNFTFTTVSPSTQTVTIGTTGTATFTVSNASLPTYTKSNI